MKIRSKQKRFFLKVWMKLAVFLQWVEKHPLVDRIICKNCVFHVDKKMKTLNVFASYYEYVAGKGIHLNNERLY